MSLTTTDYEDLKRYLLGGQPEEEEKRLEARLLAEDDLFELAQATETDLLVEHFRGGPAAEDCQGLLGRLAASPAGRRRIELARGMAAACGTVRRGRILRFPLPRLFSRPAVRASLAAALVGLVVVVWQLERPHALLPPQALALEVSTLRSDEPAPPELQLAAGIPVELRLALPAEEPFVSYGVSIRKEGGGTVWGPKRLPAPHSGAPLIVEAGDLPGGTYEVEIRGFRREGGTEDVGFLSFRVVRR
jgi:hypothetical protein